MAEVTAFRNNALEYPIYGLPWVVELPIYDNTGSIVSGAAGLDSEIAKNGDTPADCTNEATEIGSSGRYYLSLTGTELQCDHASVNVKTTTTDAKTTALGLLPQKLPTVRTGTAAGGATGSITLDSGALAIDGAYAGCVVAATIDGTVEVRKITGYVGSTKVASVTPDFTTAPDSDDTFVILQPYGVLVPSVNTTHLDGVSGAAVAAADALLKRDWTSVTGEAARSVLNALRFLRNKWTLSSTTLSVKKEDDSTEAWAGTVTTDVAAEPITGNDPS